MSTELGTMSAEEYDRQKHDSTAFGRGFLYGMAAIVPAWAVSIWLLWDAFS